LPGERPHGERGQGAEGPVSSLSNRSSSSSALHGFFPSSGSAPLASAQSKRSAGHAGCGESIGRAISLRRSDRRASDRYGTDPARSTRYASRARPRSNGDMDHDAGAQHWHARNGSTPRCDLGCATAARGAGAKRGLRGRQA
jgi:hypothetical protein